MTQPATPLPTKFEFVATSVIIRGEKPTKGIEALASANPHQMNRIVGYLPSGEKVMVAHRAGKGGMDFTKLMGGKVYAVAADAVSAVMEKDDKGKSTRVQKKEDGLPLYSSSGFYTLSSKEYPAMALFEAYARVLPGGEQMLLVTDEALAQRQTLTLDSEFDLEMLTDFMVAALDDSANLVAEYDVQVNRKREVGLRRAREDAAERDETFEGPEFQDCAVSKKDGNPMAMLVWRLADGSVDSTVVVREAEGIDEVDRPMMRYMTPPEAVQHFEASPAYRRIQDELAAGRQVFIAMAVGHVMRCSVSFRRKVQATLAEPAEKILYGDGAFIRGVANTWAKSIVGILHSQHPNFPREDYPTHHYVAGLRQAEVGMSKKPDNSGWLPPQVVPYDLEAMVLKGKA